jgi:hypothetical protein
MFDTNNILPTEELVLIRHRHWLSFFMPIFLSIVFGLGFVFLLFLAIYEASYSRSLAMFLFVLAFLGLNLVIHGVFGLIFTWQVSGYYITTERVLDFKIIPFVQNDVTVVKIANVYEVDKYEHGILAHLFGFGDIVVADLGSMHPMRLHSVPSPTTFIQKIKACQQLILEKKSKSKE